jgi:hypothetical protein
MVGEVRPSYESERAAIGAVAQKLGIGTAETQANGFARPRSMPVPVPG